LKEKYLEIQLLDNKIKIEFRNDLKITNLSLERNLYENAIMRTEIAVEKMRRVISKRLKKVNLDTELMDDLLNFSIEEKDIKENLLKREIIDLYEASKRAFSLLNRMDNLNDFGINTKMSAKTLFNTIAYEDLLSESRLLEFIEAEWNMDYQKFFESNKISKFMDKIESLWG